MEWYCGFSVVNFIVYLKVESLEELVCDRNRGVRSGGGVYGFLYFVVVFKRCYFVLFFLLLFYCKFFFCGWIFFCYWVCELREFCWGDFDESFLVRFFMIFLGRCFMIFVCVWSLVFVCCLLYSCCFFWYVGFWWGNLLGMLWMLRMGYMDFWI